MSANQPSTQPQPVATSISATTSLPRRRRRWPLVLAPFLLAAAAFGAYHHVGLRSTEPPAPPAVLPVIAPDAAELTVEPIDTPTPVESPPDAMPDAPPDAAPPDAAPPEKPDRSKKRPKKPPQDARPKKTPQDSRPRPDAGASDVDFIQPGT
jgi:hypothetical protein